MLNAQQIQAVEHGDGPMLVLAGPGSGKTAVITERTCRLIRSGTAPASILVITFTRAAAAEMRGRITRALGNRAAGIMTGTFHGIFFGILRAECGLSAGTIQSGEKRRALLEELISHAYRQEGYEPELTEQVGREISYLKNSTTKLEHFYSGVLPEETFRAVFRQYETWMSENRMLDFDDIIRNCYRLLQSRPDVLARWQKKIRYIMVDEFQDIAPMQYAVIRMLAAPQNNLFIVGDDDQSIYRFRGASPELMLGFQKAWPDAGMVVLDTNYRCTPEILQASADLIRANSRRFPKKLRADRPHGGAVQELLFDNPSEEAAWIAREMKRLNTEGLPFEEMAVLFRTNSGCRSLVEELISERIPFYAADVMPNLFDHWIAKDMISYLELAAGSNRREHFLRICNRPNRYLSRRAFWNRTISFEALYTYYQEKDWMCERIHNLEEDLAYLAKLPPFGAIQYIQSVIGYGGYLKDYAEEHNQPYEELRDILEALKESAARCTDLAGWKQHMEQIRTSLRNRSEETGAAVATLHAAKGKEYRAVFIAEVNDGIIPWHKAVLEADLEEERRMLYVGITRAKDYLALSSVRKRYGKSMKPSRFLENIDLRKH